MLQWAFFAGLGFTAVVPRLHGILGNLNVAARKVLLHAGEADVGLVTNTRLEVRRLFLTFLKLSASIESLRLKLGKPNIKLFFRIVHSERVIARLGHWDFVL